jgi:hypothetical protein
MLLLYWIEGPFPATPQVNRVIRQGIGEVEFLGCSKIESKTNGKWRGNQCLLVSKAGAGDNLQGSKQDCGTSGIWHVHGCASKSGTIGEKAEEALQTGNCVTFTGYLLNSLTLFVQRQSSACPFVLSNIVIEVPRFTVDTRPEQRGELDRPSRLTSHH